LVNRIPKKYDTSFTTNPQQIEVPVMEFEISTRGYPRVDTYPKLMPIYLTYVNNVYSLSRSRQASMIGLRVSWTTKKTNDWVLNKAGVKMELLDAVKARKLTNYGHTMRKQGSCLEKEIMQGTIPGARMRGRPRTAWMDNIKTWTGLAVGESIRMTEDRDKWRKYVHGVANPRIEDGLRTEQNSFAKRERELCKFYRKICAMIGILQPGLSQNV